MGASYAAEAIKLTRRVSTWVLFGVWVLFAAVILYVLPFVVALITLHQQEIGIAQGIEQGLGFLLPENFVGFLMGFMFSTLGTVVALILGALSAGSEHGWGTMKMILSQRPSRLGVLSGKLLFLASLLTALTVAAFVIGALFSLAVALISGAPAEAPSLSRVAGGLGSGVLLLVFWASLGFGLATLFEGSALAIALSLIYAFAIEPVVRLILFVSEDLRPAVKFFPSQNTSALIDAFSSLGAPTTAQTPPVFLDPPYAALALALYTAAFLAIATLLWTRRDVTS